MNKTEHNVKILDADSPTSRITSDTARVMPRNCFVIDTLAVLDPPEPIARTPSNQQLRQLAQEHSPAEEWYHEEDNLF